jgi:hypothetical protein
VARLNFLLGKGEDPNGLRHLCPLKNVGARSSVSAEMVGLLGPSAIRPGCRYGPSVASAEASLAGPREKDLWMFD